MEKTKQKNHLWRDSGREIQIHSRRVPCTPHRVPARTPFFRSLAKDNLADYSSRARRQFGALSCLASCFVNSFLFHFFLVFCASFATQMTMDGIVMALLSLWLIITVIISETNALAKCLSVRRKLTCSHDFNLLAVRAEWKSQLWSIYCRDVAWWAFAPQNRLTCDKQQKRQRHCRLPVDLSIFILRLRRRLFVSHFCAPNGIWGHKLPSRLTHRHSLRSCFREHKFRVTRVIFMRSLAIHASEAHSILSLDELLYSHGSWEKKRDAHRKQNGTTHHLLLCLINR